MEEERKNAKCKVDFVRLTAIGRKLDELLSELDEKPEVIYSMPFEKRREIENEMDAILSSFRQRWIVHTAPGR